jgi:uncharacterized protein (TIGR02588 family)
MAAQRTPNQVKQEDRQAQERDRPPLYEWVVAALGLLTVLYAFGFLTYEAVSDDTSPPDPLLRVTGVQEVRAGYLAQVEVLNREGDTAAGLMVEGTLKQGNQDVQTSEITLDYLPGHSARKVGLFFSKDPRRYHLELRALGYQEP